MLYLLWLLGAAVVLMIKRRSRRPLHGDDLGRVSAQWLHEYRAESNQAW